MKRYRLADDGRSQEPEAPDWPLYEHADGEWMRAEDAAEAERRQSADLERAKGAIADLLRGVSLNTQLRTTLSRVLDAWAQTHADLPFARPEHDRLYDAARELVASEAEADPAHRPWTYCVDGLPEEPGWYDCLIARPNETCTRQHRQFTGRSWLGGELVFAWSPIEPGLPLPRRRDFAAAETERTGWPSLDYLEGLEP